MATIRNGKISTTFKYVKIVGIPDLSLEPLEREYSDSELQSVASVSSSTSARAANERRKISRAEGCFITKQPGYHLERAHWVNVVRKNARLKYEVVRLKKIHFQSSLNLKHSSIQENLLIDLHIVRRGFSLEAPPNIAPCSSAVSRFVLQATDYQLVDRNLHYTLAKLGFFAVTCSKETFLSLISLVEKENEEWQARDGDYTRRFEVGVRSYPHSRY
ncbi:hypothetical protein GALMADRAFT_1196707 [Galerina marginata CBS 339.88]|uniref:Uncharacterized protein n=1 Tax=Galerina marginata (strain CBS 339.88) TaxID=685588 RepID=A0A067TN89_GALM3|nr:hypothetical protein GALMADRAFT_1196707 [Galerina marginata CBS 339.88]